MRNTLYFYNMGKRECNKRTFLTMLKTEFEIYEKELESIVSGYKFLFNSETGSEIKVLFFDNGTQLMTVFQGELAEDVIAVYQAFANCFFDED